MPSDAIPEGAQPFVSGVTILPPSSNRVKDALINLNPIGEKPGLFKTWSQAQKHDIHAVMVKDVFRRAGLEYSAFPDAYVDCVAKCAATHVLGHNDWKKWDGRGEAKRMLLEMNELNVRRGTQWCLPAPLLVAIYITKTVRCVHDQEDEVSRLIDKHFLFHKLATSIVAYERGLKSIFLVTMPSSLADKSCNEESITAVEVPCKSTTIEQSL
ncbi:hypothetical protein S40293_11139 [Stachybotrys chartarum IBT 40293]|nr:hypothetical protein S40293_11139 [Stachybotrys chartarum IBT 40293]